MRLKFRLTFLLIIITTFLSAQNLPFSIQKSDIIQDEFKETVLVLAEKDSDGNLIFGRYYESRGISNVNGIIIEKYNPSLKLQKELDFKIEEVNYKKYSTIVGAFLSENKIHVIEIYYNLNEKAIICESNSISEEFIVSKKELFRLSKDEVQNLGFFSLQQIAFDRSKEIWNNRNSGDIITETDLSKSESTFPRIDSNVFLVVN